MHAGEKDVPRGLRGIARNAVVNRNHQSQSQSSKSFHPTEVEANREKENKENKEQQELEEVAGAKMKGHTKILGKGGKGHALRISSAITKAYPTKNSFGCRLIILFNT